MKTSKTAAALATAFGLATLGAAGAASAHVVCNAEGDCWHTDRRVDYGPDARLTYHPDDWYFHQHWDANHHWRDYHEGRGFYRGGVWVPR
ncbi:MAG TPA: hypothetical protein VFE18_11890 [Phenylobacterium sp.]|nr:hypothetical protein [Phenylobacterium sp.]